MQWTVAGWLNLMTGKFGKYVILGLLVIVNIQHDERELNINDCYYTGLWETITHTNTAHFAKMHFNSIP